MTTILNRVQELSELPVAKIRATLTLEDYAAKDITAALKDAGVSGKKVQFAESFYGWLADEQRDDSDVRAYILGDGEFGETSGNVQNHLNHYVNIADLARLIWNQ
jgi:hypothetical protein